MKTTSNKPKIDVFHIAHLARIPITPDEEVTLEQGFVKTLSAVDQLNKLDTNHVEPTHQVTGFSDVFRDDTVDVSRMFTQEKALSNAKRTHNGYFVVDQILEE